MSTKKYIATTELISPELDYYVARSLGRDAVISDDLDCALITLQDNNGTRLIKYRPSIDYSQGGPIIENQNMTVEFQGILDDEKCWSACYGLNPVGENSTVTFGTSILEAAMRCFVKKHFGDEVERI